MSFVENWFSFAARGRDPWFDLAGGRIELFFALLFAFIGLVTILYSFGRVRGRAGLVAEYFVFLVILVASALGVVYARNLLLLFVCWEVATFAIWRLVMYNRSEEGVAASSWMWFVNFAAAALMMVGLAIILFEEKTLSLDRLRGTEVALLPTALIFIGILAKSATLPLYIWLPKAYRGAPAPVCALLSGVGESIAVVLFFKLFVATVQVPAGFFSFVAGLALASSIFAGGLALRSTTTRGTLAYSTVSQLGFIFLGMAVAGYYGLLGAMLYVLAHAVAKAGLFFSFGLVEDATGRRELALLGGAARRAPVLAGASAFLMLSVMGMPPLLGFFAKLDVVIGALRHHLLLGVLAVVAALFTVLYFTRLYTAVFLGAKPPGEWQPVPAWHIALVVLMALVSLAGGVLIVYPVRFLEPGLMALLGAS